MKKTNRIKTKILAAALSATMVFSFGAMTATTASAATNWNIGLSDDTQKEITDGFFSGAQTMIGLLTKSHPVAGVIASGLFGAFKSFYGDATKTPQPSNQDIVNLLGELSDKIDDHFNAQSSQVKALQNIQNLQNFSKILTSVKGYNENAMGQIAIFDEDNVCAQDYQNIIDCTVGNDEFVKDFMDLSNLIIDGQKGTKGLPTFDQYLELSKVCKENNNDAALIKKDSANFNQMTLDQYSLFFTNLITGLLAKYELAEYNYNNGTIDLMTNVMCPVRQTEIIRNNQTCEKHLERVIYTYGLAV